MKVQIKLYKVFENNKYNTLSKLYEYFNKEEIEEIDSNIVGIYYDYKKSNLRDIDKLLLNLDIDSEIITNEIFYNIIKQAIYENIMIDMIKLNCELDGSEEYIKEKLDDINFRYKDKSKDIIEDIIEELEWAYNEENVAISEIDLRIKDEMGLLLLKICRDGIVICDSKSIVKYAKEIIKKSLI